MPVERETVGTKGHPIRDGHNMHFKSKLIFQCYKSICVHVHVSVRTCTCTLTTVHNIVHLAHHSVTLHVAHVFLYISSQNH